MALSCPKFENYAVPILWPVNKKYAAAHTNEICIPQLSPHNFFLTHKFRHGFQAWWIENNVLFVWVCALLSRRGLSDYRFLNRNQKRSFGNGQCLLLHSLWLNIWDSQRTLEKGTSSKQDFACFFHRKSNTKNKNCNRVENDQNLCCVHLSVFNNYVLCWFIIFFFLPPTPTQGLKNWLVLMKEKRCWCYTVVENKPICWKLLLKSVLR